MKEFYKIKTTDFKPISFNNLYLFNEYNKIKNFLISNDQESLLNKLAIPKINKKEINWLSVSENEIYRLDHFETSTQQVILNKYQEFVQEFKVYLSDLNKSNNKDKKNWSKLLSYIIYGSANELFYDGKNIYITWGWELINENSKSLIPKFISSNNILDEQITIPTNEKNYSHQIKTETNLNETHKITFLDRCHNFVRKNWWITPSLTLIIFLLLILGF